MIQRNILIADDDEDLVDALSRRCRGLGLRTLTARNALQALTKINHVRPDLVILDVDMPGGTGLSACEMMANNHELSSIPVIILTGRTDSETVRRCHVSCAYYVSKSSDVWHRIEPLLCDLLHLGAASEMLQAH